MGRDVKGKNQGMDGTGSADPGTRMAAEERATEERTTDERTMEDIIKDATDRYLDSFPEKEITVSDLEDMVSRHDRKTRKRTVRAAGFAALFVIVVAGIFFVSGGYFDVGADKNPKEQIVKDDMVVSKDGGYGDDGGVNEFTITDWDDIKSGYSDFFQELLIPEYIPKGYEFEKLIIQDEVETITYKYFFKNNTDILELHEYKYSGALDSIETRHYDDKIKCEKGYIYINKDEGTNKATIQIKNNIIVDIWGPLTTTELVNLLNNLK